MFNLIPNPAFEADVEIPVPGKPNAVVKFQFRYKDTEELSDFSKRLVDLNDVDSIVEVTEGWSGVDTDFSKAAVETLVKKYGGVAIPILKKYFDELMKARRGN
jgi:hypothetical protein